jgi:hypothetical protein
MKREFELSDGTILNIGETHIVLYETYEPILFTTKNDKNEIFICVSVSDRKERKIWLVRKTTNKTIFNMVFDKITIREAFLKSKGVKYTIVLMDKYEVLEDADEYWNAEKSLFLPADEMLEFDLSERFYYLCEFLKNGLVFWSRKDG